MHFGQLDIELCYKHGQIRISMQFFVHFQNSDLSQKLTKAVADYSYFISPIMNPHDIQKHLYMRLLCTHIIIIRQYILNHWSSWSTEAETRQTDMGSDTGFSLLCKPKKRDSNDYYYESIYHRSLLNQDTKVTCKYLLTFCI